MSYLDEGRARRSEQQAKEGAATEAHVRELMEFVRRAATEKWAEITGQQLDPAIWAVTYQATGRLVVPFMASAYATLDGLVVFLTTGSTLIGLCGLQALNNPGVLSNLDDLMVARAMNGLE